jgi:phospholipase/carboxylesterase
MALYTGLNYPQKLAGIVCFSGYLPKFQDFKELLNEGNRKTEVLMAHGL